MAGGGRGGEMTVENEPCSYGEGTFKNIPWRPVGGENKAIKRNYWVPCPNSLLYVFLMII